MRVITRSIFRSMSPKDRALHIRMLAASNKLDPKFRQEGRRIATNLEIMHRRNQQLMASGFAWREMRDQWGMDAAAITTATRWAIKAMLADLERRGNTPLADGAA